MQKNVTQVRYISHINFEIENNEIQVTDSVLLKEKTLNKSYNNEIGRSKY